MHRCPFIMPTDFASQKVFVSLGSEISVLETAKLKRAICHDLS
ncbi:hypothetical protein LBWT_X3730 (plasmid) [Leptolyngbya boryana IAM M-101]|nr:hypothetical protein LBWT_X3730 [Leptolyngbya boryana IAM M-101]BAS66649.1 hypothetical protein LBDG_X3730 [Leptolyngbya boryana dg5]